jgi:hypothetical protein
VVSDTQHDQAVHVADTEAERERDRQEARELAYHEVSLRAVELLASAQRAADEAVAEAQSYARDLEETAREQYRHILQKAHDAARLATGGAAGEGATGDEASDEPAGAETGPPSAGAGLDGRELEYVRTYARVAHTQLKAVLGALNDELDRLADLADGSSPSPADVASEPTQPDTSHEQPGGEGLSHEEPYGDGPDAVHHHHDQG